MCFVWPSEHSVITDVYYINWNAFHIRDKVCPNLYNVIQITVSPQGLNIYVLTIKHAKQNKNHIITDNS